MLPDTTDAPADTSDPPQRPRSAIRHWPAHLKLWPIAALGLWADLATKDWAFTTLGTDESRSIIPKLVSFQLSLNDGALFGVGRGFAPVFIAASILALLFVLYLFANSTPNRHSFHVALALILAGAMGNLYDRVYTVADVVTVMARGAPDDATPRKIRMIGKIVGEQEDRLIIGQWPNGAAPRPILRSDVLDQSSRGVVRDFVKIDLSVAGYPMWPWIFNIADVLLVIGVGVLLLNFWAERHERLAESQAAGSEQASPADE